MDSVSFKIPTRNQTYSFKNCWYVFFFANHNLESSEYFGNYKIVPEDALGKYQNECIILNKQWVLLFKPQEWKKN